MQLKPENWPEIDQALWHVAIRKPKLFETEGPAAKWRPASLVNVSKSYGRWLEWLRRKGLLVSDVQPITRYTRQNLGDFFDEISAATSPRTASAYLNGMGMAIEAMQPEIDIGWYWDIANLVRRSVRPVKSKRGRVMHASDLFALGIRMMASAEKLDGIKRAMTFRDGLLIALLAARPIRLKNLHQIQLGRHLLNVGNRYVLRFDESETKTAIDLEFVLPEELTDRVSEYILLHRPVLLESKINTAEARGTAAGEALWIARGGTQMFAGAISQRIKLLTARHTKHDITPHLFRDCVANSVAIDCPEQFAIAAQLLGHATLATTEKYYVLAQGRKAAAIHQSIVLKMRRSGARKNRNNNPNRGS